jgi:hypothetical protein
VEIGRERVEVGVTDFGLTELRHRGRVADEELHELGRQILAIERGRDIALVLELQRRRAGRIRGPARVTRAAPIAEHGRAALDGRASILGAGRRAAPGGNRKRRVLGEHGTERGYTRCNGKQGPTDATHARDPRNRCGQMS